MCLADYRLAVDGSDALYWQLQGEAFDKANQVGQDGTGPSTGVWASRQPDHPVLSVASGPALGRALDDSLLAGDRHQEHALLLVRPQEPIPRQRDPRS